jgi:hypothetical protein
MPGSGSPSKGTAGEGLRVFVNYRHEDTRWAAWALYFKLEEEFGAENVFFDNGTLRGGMQWFDEIRSRVGDRGVFLALIGPRWRSSLLSHLQEGASDYVAREIGLALLSGTPLSVIPVLVDDAEPPNPLELPPSLRALPGYQAERLRHTHARLDIAVLVERLRELGGLSGSEEQSEASGSPGSGLARRG